MTEGSRGPDGTGARDDVPGKGKDSTADPLTAPKRLGRFPSLCNPLRFAAAGDFRLASNEQNPLEPCMAKRRPTSEGPSSPQGTADDAFTARILEFIAWSRQNTQALIGIVLVLVVAVVGGIYYLNQRSTVQVEATLELERIQTAAMLGESEATIADLREFITRYRRTPLAIEARLVLAEVYLDEERPADAVEVLSEVAPSFRDPLRLQATILLAAAHETAEDWAGAAEVYRELTRRAEFSFQRRQAAEGLARVLLVESDTAGAIDAYRSALEELDEDSPERGVLEMRLSELTGGEPHR